MNAAIQQGPIPGSALFVSVPRRDAKVRTRTAARTTRIAARRPIGIGPRAILVTNPACKATRRTARVRPVAPRVARRTWLYAGCLGSLLFSAAAFGLSFAVDTPRTLMARSDYVTAREAIAAQARAETGQCRELPPSARDICRAETRANERMRRAELDARYHGTVASAAEVQRVAAKARFDVSRARCNALDAQGRVDCLRSARAEESRALAAARPAST